MFDLAGLSVPEITILKKLSLCAPVPVNKILVKQWLDLKSLDRINELVKKGWLISYGKELFLHNVIGEILLYKYRDEITCSHYKDFIDRLTEYTRIKETESGISKKEGIIHCTSVTRYLHDENERIATLYNEMALIYQDLGELQQATTFQEKAIAIKEKVLSPDHPYLATSYNNMSLIYQDLGELQQATAFQEKAIAIREKVLSPDHPSLATSYNNMASIYRDLGDDKSAREYWKKYNRIKQK